MLLHAAVSLRTEKNRMERGKGRGEEKCVCVWGGVHVSPQRAQAVRGRVNIDRVFSLNIDSSV